MSSIVDQEYYLNRKPGTKSYRVISSTIEAVLEIAQEQLGKPRAKLIVLDVGCGSGEYSFEIAKQVKMVVGIEPYKAAYQKAQENKNKQNNLKFVNCLIEDYTSKVKFDLVLSLATIEHMPNACKSFKNIFSLMKPGGLIYLTAPNRWWPLESHYHLPFLSLLPLPLANFYLKVTNRGYSYQSSSYSKSYFGLKKFFDKFDCSYKFLLPNPDSPYLGCGQDGRLSYQIRGLGIWLIKQIPLMWVFSKGFIMVIKKLNRN